MKFFPGQETFFRNLGEWWHRKWDTLLIVFAIAAVFIGICFLGYRDYIKEQNNRRIDYLVTINSVEERLHEHSDTIDTLSIVLCTDRKGDQHRFAFDGMQTLEPGKQYILRTKGSDPMREIITIRTVTTDKWLREDD